MTQLKVCPCECHVPGKTRVTSGHVVERLVGALICIPCPECAPPPLPQPATST